MGSLPRYDGLLDIKGVAVLYARPSSETFISGPSGFREETVHPFHRRTWYKNLLDG
jgi:hypothetical protein